MGRKNLYAIAMGTYGYISMRISYIQYKTIVIDPSIRLTWMELNWEQDEVARVKDVILRQVSLLLLIVTLLTVSPDE